MIDMSKEVGKAIDAAMKGRERVEQTLLKGVEKSLIVIEGDARRDCPVEDGRLRASITHEVSATPEEARGRVGTNVDYAPYVHEGTGRYARAGNGRKTPWKYVNKKTGDAHWTHGVRPRPFLRNAMDKNKARIAEIMREAVKDL